MRCIEKTSVGYCRSHISHLQRGNTQLALPDRKRNVKTGAPAVASPAFGVVIAAPQDAGLFIRKVYPEFMADAEFCHRVMPAFVSIYRTHSCFVDHQTISITVIS